eukprot:359650-Chlamydomonas_euryale.AAC.6
MRVHVDGGWGAGFRMTGNVAVVDDCRVPVCCPCGDAAARAHACPCPATSASASWRTRCLCLHACPCPAASASWRMRSQPRSVTLCLPAILSSHTLSPTLCLMAHALPATLCHTLPPSHSLQPRAPSHTLPHGARAPSRPLLLPLPRFHGCTYNTSKHDSYLCTWHNLPSNLPPPLSQPPPGRTCTRAYSRPQSKCAFHPLNKHNIKTPALRHALAPRTRPLPAPSTRFRKKTPPCAIHPLRTLSSALSALWPALAHRRCPASPPNPAPTRQPRPRPQARGLPRSVHPRACGAHVRCRRRATRHLHAVCRGVCIAGRPPERRRGGAQRCAARDCVPSGADDRRAMAPVVCRHGRAGGTGARDVPRPPFCAAPCVAHAHCIYVALHSAPTRTTPRLALSNASAPSPPRPVRRLSPFPASPRPKPRPPDALLRPCSTQLPDSSRMAHVCPGGGNGNAR